MSRLDANQLEKTIEELFKFMQKMGVPVSQDAKEDITHSIVGELTGTLSEEQCQDKNMQCKLLDCMVKKMMGQDKEFENSLFDIKQNEESRMDKDPKAENSLKLGMMLLKVLTDAFKPENEKGEKKERSTLVEKLMSKMKELRMDKKENKDEKEEEKELQLAKEQEKQLDETLRNLFGGSNPTVDNDMPSVVFEIVGDLVGCTNQSTADPESSALMVDKITANTGKEDPLGLENICKTLDQSDGVSMSAVFSPTNTPD